MAKKQNDLISFPMHLPREVERLFDEMIHRPWGFCRDIRGWNPSVDLRETKTTFILEADLPGVRSEDVKVEVQRSSGHFMRRIKLPESVDKDAIQAEFHDGVLRVILPKAKKGEA